MKKRKRKRYKTQLRRAKPTGGPTPSAAKKNSNGKTSWTEQSIYTLTFTYPNWFKFNFIMDNIMKDLKVVWVFIE